MTSERWNPLQQMMSLRRAMDRLLEESLVPPAMALAGARAAGSSVPLDIADAGDAYVVYASLPGVDPDHLRVTVQGDLLTLQGEQVKPQPAAGWRWLLREQPAGALSRTVRLPEPIDADRAEAELAHGRLRLTLPKRTAALPQRIRVGGAMEQMEALREEEVVRPAGAPEVARPVAAEERIVAGQAGAAAGRPEATEQTLPAITPETPVQPQSQADLAAAGAERKDLVTQGSEESFPASDAPSWTPERA